MDSAYMPFGGKYKHFVLGIDAFSRKISAKLVSGLKSPAMNRAIIARMNELGGNYQRPHTDKGTDFSNSLVKKTFDRLKVDHFFGY